MDACIYVSAKREGERAQANEDQTSKERTTNGAEEQMKTCVRKEITKHRNKELRTREKNKMKYTREPSRNSISRAERQKQRANNRNKTTKAGRTPPEPCSGPSAAPGAPAGPRGLGGWPPPSPGPEGQHFMSATVSTSGNLCLNPMQFLDMAYNPFCMNMDASSCRT